MTRGSPFVWIAGVPAAAVLILLLAVVWLSLTNGVPAIPGGPYALNHVEAMLLSSETWLVLENTLVFASIATAIAMVGGTAVAWVVERTDLPGPQFVYAGLTLALLIPGFFPAMGWLFLLGPRIGIVGRVLHQTFGLPQDAITIANAPGMGFVQGLLLVPLAFVLVGPALRTVSGELLEAADVHGLSLIQRVRLVELPVVTPALIAASIYCFMVAVASFEVPGFIGMAYRQFTFSTYVYQLTNPPNGQPQYGPPAAIALIAIVVAILLTLAYQRAIRRGASYQVVTGRGYRPSPYRLGRKRAGVYAGIGFYFVLIFVMPLMLVLWVAVMPYFQVPSVAALKVMTLANFVNSPWPLAWAGTSHTLELMLCVPLAAVAMGLIASWVIVKSRSRLRGAIDMLLFLPHAVPGIVFAMALLTLALFVISRYLPLAGTVFIIGIAYLLVYISFAVRSMSVAVVQVSSDLEEAAYVGGLSVGRTMTAVFLPLVSQAALNAWVWIALLVGRELTMAVVLFTPANITLPAVIWSTWFTGELGQSSAMSLVFMVIFLPVVLVYLLQRANGRRSETTALVS